MSAGSLFLNRTKRSGYHLLLVALVLALVVISGYWRLQELLDLGGEIGLSGSNKTVVVSEGDTLWHIARKHGPAGVDTRKVVATIKQLNGLNDAQIAPGMVLQIPE
ncbi:MAG TPA: LysM peptidoglycan-binding domain-containing protein [Firmicutes bacterium]|nr:LysM peptidoglycan-binding domain-containing protein [Bacillota bacterium]